MGSIFQYEMSLKECAAWLAVLACATLTDYCSGARSGLAARQGRGNLLSDMHYMH